MFRTAVLMLCAAALTAANAPAPAKAAGPPSAELKTLMCDRGKVLFDEEFSTESLAKNWGGFIAGTWTPGDSLVQVTGIAGAHHPQRGHHLELTDAIIQVAIKLDGATWAGVGLDSDKAGHVVRFNLHGDSVDLQRWTGIGKDPKDDRIDGMNAKLGDGQWHALLWEIHGTEMIASIDEQQVMYGSADGIDIAKSSVSLFASETPGKSVSFAHLKVWESTPKADWEKKRKAQILAYKAKRH